MGAGHAILTLDPEAKYAADSSDLLRDQRTHAVFKARRTLHPHFSLILAVWKARGRDRRVTTAKIVFERLKQWAIHWAIHDWQLNAHMDRAWDTERALTFATSISVAKSLGTLRWVMQQWRHAGPLQAIEISPPT